MALTTEQLTAMLNAGTQPAPPANLSNPDMWNKWMAGFGTPAPAPAITQAPAAPTTPPPSFIAPNGQPGQVNVPFGSAYFEPSLQSYTALAGQKEQGRQFDLGQSQQQRQFDATMGQNAGQFNVQTLLNAAQALASLFSQGPQSAAELAFLQAGMGFPAIGGARPAMEDLIGSATRGASGSAPLDFGNGQGVSIPNTLSGQQMQGLSANKNLAGVLGSFAKAAGNPDLFARSIAALIPSNYRPLGSGM